jgi:hypothetical protein
MSENMALNTIHDDDLADEALDREAVRKFTGAATSGGTCLRQ